MKKVLVAVNWVDSTASAQWLDDCDCHSLARLVSVGWLVGHAYDSISLSTTRYSEGWLGAVTIPKVAITRLRVVETLGCSDVAIDGDVDEWELFPDAEGHDDTCTDDDQEEDTEPDDQLKGFWFYDEKKVDAE